MPNIYEGGDSEHVELISVVSQQPARQTADGNTPVSIADIPLIGEGWADGSEDDADEDDDEPLLDLNDGGGSEQLFRVVSDPGRLVLGRGPFWAGRLWCRWERGCGACEAMMGNVKNPAVYTVIYFVVVMFLVVFGILGVILPGTDCEWDRAHYNDSDDVDSDSCHIFARTLPSWLSVLAVGLFAFYVNSVKCWQAAGPKEGQTVLDKASRVGTREFGECASFWCCEKLPGLFCDWVCSSGCGGGGILQGLCAGILGGPGAAEYVDRAKAGECIELRPCSCNCNAGNVSRRPRTSSLHDTPFACGSGRCFLPTGFCPCLSTRRLLWWAASEYPDDEATRIAANVLAGSQRAEVVEYAPTQSATSCCLFGVAPLGSTAHDTEYAGYRCPLSLACELNKPKLAAPPPSTTAPPSGTERAMRCLAGSNFHLPPIHRPT